MSWEWLQFLHSLICADWKQTNVFTLSQHLILRTWKWKLFRALCIFSPTSSTFSQLTWNSLKAVITFHKDINSVTSVKSLYDYLMSAYINHCGILWDLPALYWLDGSDQLRKKNETMNYSKVNPLGKKTTTHTSLFDPVQCFIDPINSSSLIKSNQRPTQYRSLLIARQHGWRQWYFLGDHLCFEYTFLLTWRSLHDQKRKINWVCA